MATLTPVSRSTGISGHPKYTKILATKSVSLGSKSRLWYRAFETYTLEGAEPEELATLKDVEVLAELFRGRAFPYMLEPSEEEEPRAQPRNIRTQPVRTLIAPRRRRALVFTKSSRVAAPSIPNAFLAITALVMIAFTKLTDMSYRSAAILSLVISAGVCGAVWYARRRSTKRNSR